MLKGRFERLAMKGVFWIFIIFLIGIAVLMAGATWEIRQKEKIAFREKENARKQFEETSQRLALLTENVDNLSDERGLEEEFRKRFPVARDGEEVVVLVDAQPPAVDTTPVTNKSLWLRIKGWLGL